MNYGNEVPPGHMLISQLNHHFFIVTLDDMTIQESKVTDYSSPNIPIHLNLCVLLREKVVVRDMEYPALYPSELYLIFLKIAEIFC